MELKNFGYDQTEDAFFFKKSIATKFHAVSKANIGTPKKDEPVLASKAKSAISL